MSKYAMPAGRPAGREPGEDDGVARAATAESSRSRRGEVLEVAARIFNEKGYRIATLEDIGDELGFTRAALYYYFKSKQEILTAIIDEAVDLLMTSFRAILAEDLGPSERLRRIVTNHIAVVHSRPDVFGVFLAERTSLPGEVQARMVDNEQEYVGLVTAVIEEGVKRREFSPDIPSKVAVLLILGMANGTARWFRPTAKRGSLDAATLGELAYRMITEGLALAGRPAKPARKRAPAAKRAR